MSNQKEKPDFGQIAIICDELSTWRATGILENGAFRALVEQGEFANDPAAYQIQESVFIRKLLWAFPALLAELIATQDAQDTLRHELVEVVAPLRRATHLLKLQEHHTSAELARSLASHALNSSTIITSLELRLKDAIAIIDTRKSKGKQHAD